MTMQREEMRAQMQTQRPARKRQLYEVAPSPPQKWRPFYGKGTPNSSPGSTPGKGPLRDNDDDDVPSFRARSFYGAKKKLPFEGVPQQTSPVAENADPESSNSVFDSLLMVKTRQPEVVITPYCLRNKTRDVSDDENEATSPASENVDSSPMKKRTRRADKKNALENVNLKAVVKRKALSPIKNIIANIFQSDTDGIVEEDSGNWLSDNEDMEDKSEDVASPTEAVVTRKRRAASLPTRVQPKAKNRKPLPPLSKPVEDEDKSSKPADISPNGRKFFKHKSPASATKAIGGIIVGRGFNLKFVPGSLNKDLGKSSGKKNKDLGKSSGKKKGTPKRKPQKRRNSGSKSASKAALKAWSDTSLPWQAEQSLALTSAKTTLPLSVSETNTQQSGSVPPQPSPGSVPPQPTPSSSSLHSSLFMSTDDESEISGQHIPTSPVPEADATQEEEDGQGEDGQYYSIFSKRRRSRRLAVTYSSPRNTGTGSPKQRKFVSSQSDGKQLVLDAGQEQFGATQCEVCGMVYTPSDATDEATHAKFHQHALAALKFPGWKKERVIKEFLDDGSRVIVVLPEDQRFMVKKIEELNQVMGQELGFPDQVFSFHGSYKAFLYISEDKRVEGCCIAEAITKGYKVLPVNGENEELPDSQRPWFCSPVPEKASVGIGRLWVYGPSRKRGIATRLINCVRNSFEYGLVIHKNKVAFSDPTPDGRRFAAKYTDTPNFLVYKYIHGHAKPVATVQDDHSAE